ncbi:uncharacterized protein LOC127700661 isoform X1 [Mytilus californianus]|uniref:uncharacterized protein LOC127700661 isoform X1 n=1 Tax=Mytilus californianus TaxID=6549 RepID=UPI0022479120|nr:uncharacterized protein LOC127700661 isoform X1 [Mytilus californianus]
MKFLTPLSLLVITVFTGCKGLPEIPKILGYPCEVPVADRLFLMCCKAENIYTSSVFFFQNTTDNIIAKIDHPCYVTTGRGLISWNCQTSGHIRTFRINTTRNASHSTGLWGCGYYGGRSSFSLTENKIVTRNSGNHYAKLHDNTTLTWMVHHRDYKIYMPDGQLLETSDLKHAIDINTSSISVTLYNIAEKDNGTYICVSDQNKRRDAITLIVVEPPLRPSILALKTEFSGHTMTLNLTCQTNSLSAGPPYYVPQFNVSWLYSTTASYKVFPDGNFLIIKDFDCNLKNSRPVLCSLKESPGEWNPSVSTHPHKQCVLRPNVITKSDSKTDKSAQTAGYVIAGISLSVFVFGILGYTYFKIYRRRRDHGQSTCYVVRSCCCDQCDVLLECCEEVTESCQESCKDKCCKMCKKADSDDEPLDLEIPGRLRRTRRTTEDDLQNILNLYSVQDTPTVTPQQQRRVTFSTDNQGAVTNDIDILSGATGTNEVVLNESIPTNSASGVNQPALVIELETCLKQLSRLVSTTENQVQVRRSHIIEDMLNIYTDANVVSSRLHVKLIGEGGSDWGGVSRDVFTTFWNATSSAFFQGDSVHVPYLPLVNMENENKFLLLGRILTHSTAILGFLPIQISTSVLMVMVYNTTEIEEHALVEDFLLYLDTKDRKLVKEAIDDFSKLSENQVRDLQELFFRYEMGCMLRPDSFRSHLLKIARNELCVKPRALCEKMRQGIPEDHFDRFWCHLTVDHIDLLHARLKPSAEKILNCLKPVVPFGDLTRRRRRVYEFFQEFIEKLGDEDLLLLLQLITGQSCVPKRTIQVEFSELGGVQRRPVFHTCSYMVELPDTYTSFKDFEKEMNNIMNSDILQFDMA